AFLVMFLSDTQDSGSVIAPIGEKRRLWLSFHLLVGLTQGKNASTKTNDNAFTDNVRGKPAGHKNNENPKNSSRHHRRRSFGAAARPIAA
ncbi:MAG: hypothetical protein E6861_23665, partial [Stenotrophomonas maltophilia]|nr:hypothetical protein [Stenotrophomonas maltophilia]